MKELIESGKSINEITETLFSEKLTETGAGWKSIKDQPNVKTAILQNQAVKGNAIIQHFSKASLQNLSSLSKKPPLIYESVSLFIKPNSMLGAFIEDRLTLIYISKKANCTLLTWNKKGDKIIVPSSYQDRLIAIGDNVPFMCQVQSVNSPLVLFFNQSTQKDFLKIPAHLDVKNPQSKYFNPQ